MPINPLNLTNSSSSAPSTPLTISTTHTTSTSLTSTVVSSSSVTSTTTSGSAVLQHIQSHRDVPVEQLFTKLDIVGKGAYGAVYKGIHNATRTVLALKVINLDTAEDDITEIQREVALLSQLRDSDKHNCIGYHGCYFYQTELWIAMDFASGGSIRTLLKPGKIEEKYAQLIIRETLIGLNYLHRQQIIHRDIKSANILLTNSHRVLLCDFGIAAPLQSTNHKRSTFIGTPYWMAPEVITDGKLYDTKADIWSLGITLYEMLNGNPPFSDLTPAKVILKIPRSQPAKLEGNQFSNGVKEFLAACLIDEPNDRPSAEELSKHKWIKSIHKASLTPLKDLTVRYSKWINSGGVRQSLADISTSEQNVDPPSPTLDKADWDFMDDHELDSCKSNNDINSSDQRDHSADGPATVRPPHSAPMMPRRTRPHRLMQLFEEDPVDNALPMFGFPTPGISPGPQNDSRMELPAPIISIPTTEELENFLESPPVSDPSSLNRPSSPSNSYNRSITPTPSRLNHNNPGAYLGSGQASSNSRMADGSTPLLPSSDTHSNGVANPPPSPFNQSTGLAPTVSSSPSLPVVARKDSEASGAGSSRSRANTAPATQERMASAMNSPALPSPMFNRGNFPGNGKQFSGNGFSFGRPSAGSSCNSPVTPAMSSHLSEPHPSYSAVAHNYNNLNGPSSSSTYPRTISPDTERNPKSANASSNGYQQHSGGNLVANVPAASNMNRTRSMADSSNQLINGKLGNPALASSVNSTTSQSIASSSNSHGNYPNSLSSTGPTLSSRATIPSKNHNKHSSGSGSSNNPVQSIPNWPTGDRIKSHKEINYHQLNDVKDVKNELEANLTELSRWLETCETGLSLLIDNMK